MNRRLLLALVLGAWVAGTLFMWMVATQNFATVDRILVSPPTTFQTITAKMPHAETREVLRWEASELNRFYFDRWGLAQLPLAALALALAWKGGKRLRIAILLAAVIAVVLQLHVVPETIHIGRELDFVPPEPETPLHAAFWQLHNAYTGFDMLKFLLLSGCCIALGRQRDPR